MKYFRTLVALAAAVLLSAAAMAQTVAPQPGYVDPGSINDFGNGPLEVKILTGSAQIGAALETGTLATSTATILTMVTTPTTLPCVGCYVGSNAGATTTTVVSATGKTISLTATLGALTPGTSVIAWGIPCAAAPVTGQKAALLQAGQPSGDYPFYTAGRICGYAQNGPGAMVLTFPIGAH